MITLNDVFHTDISIHQRKKLMLCIELVDENHPLSKTQQLQILFIHLFTQMKVKTSLKVRP